MRQSGVDPDRVARFASDINRSTKRLETIGAIPLETFLGDEDLQDIARSRLLTAIEAAIALCFHVCSRTIGLVPEQYGQCFTILAANRVISVDLAARMVRMAGFRNRLVHVYWDTDWRQVHGIVRGDLGDLEEFLRQVGVATELNGTGDSCPPRGADA